MAWTSLDRIAKRIGSDSFADLPLDTKQRLVQITESIEQALSLPPWGFRLSNATVTEYLPRRSLHVDDIDLADYQPVDGKIVPMDFDAGSNVLQLSFAPVLLADLEIREDLGGYAGQGDSAFGSGTVLTEGSDYYLDCDEVGLSRSGKVFRLGCNWPTVARCLKVTYKGGPAAQVAASLGVDFTRVYEEVVLNCTLHNYSFHEQQRASYASGQQGQVQTSESLGKYSRGYGAPQGTVNGSSWQFGAVPDLLPEELTRALTPFVNVGALLMR